VKRKNGVAALKTEIVVGKFVVKGLKKKWKKQRQGKEDQRNC